MELVRNALRKDGANPEERLEAAGPAGAPFAYANAVRISSTPSDVRGRKEQGHQVEEWVDVKPEVGAEGS